jgi:hypothetical protein
MDHLTRSDLNALLTPSDGWCVSLYAPTHRNGTPEDQIRFKEQLNDAERGLIERGMRTSDAADFLAPARHLLTAANFWRAAGDGLALFLADGTLRTYRLPLSFAECVIVGQRFHVTPVLPYLSGDGRFYILALSQNHVGVLEGTAHTVHAITIPKLPANLPAAEAQHDRDEPLNYHTHPAPVGRALAAVYHGQGVGIDDHKTELRKYFQAIDKAITAALDDRPFPLVMATVDYLAAMYRALSKYPQLVNEQIKGNPEHLSARELHDRAWPLVAPIFKARTLKAIARCRQLAGTGRTANELAEVLMAAHRGELESLFVVAGREIWGRFDPVTGYVEEHAIRESTSEELVNLAATDALKHGRVVEVVEPDGAFENVAVTGVYFTPMAKHGK